MRFKGNTMARTRDFREIKIKRTREGESFIPGLREVIKSFLPHVIGHLGRGLRGAAVS
jgi:hypothetical protein